MLLIKLKVKRCRTICKQIVALTHNLHTWDGVKKSIFSESDQIKENTA